MPQQIMPPRSPPVDRAGTARRSFWIAWAATVTFFAAFYALLTPLPRYLTAVGLPDEQIGLVLAAFGVAALLGRPAAPIPRRCSPYHGDHSGQPSALGRVHHPAASGSCNRDAR